MGGDLDEFVAAGLIRPPLGPVGEHPDVALPQLGRPRRHVAGQLRLRVDTDVALAQVAFDLDDREPHLDVDAPTFSHGRFERDDLVAVEAQRG